MSMTGRILALNTQAEELERRANNGDKKAGEGAAKAYEEATKLAEQHYGRLHEETLNLLEKWAYSVRNAGTLAQATSCHLQNVERTLENLQQCQRLNVPEDELVTAQKRHLDAQRQLAETYVQAEKFPEAIKLYEDILNSKVTRSDQELYEDGADLTSALYKSNLDGNIMRAAQLNTLMLRGADQKLGRSNVETVNIRFNLAKDLYSLGRYSEASARYAELLQILEAPDCMARLSPKYDYYLTGTKKSQDNCRNAIARIEEKARLRIEQKNRRTEEAMSDKGKQLVVRGSISQNENETHATASRAENTHDQNRSKEKLAQPAEKKDEHNRTTNMQSGSRAEQSKETPSHTNQADSSDMPVKHSVKDVSGPRNLHGAANQEGSDTRRKSTVEWIPDTNAHAWKEMRRHVPARPRSASATLNPHHAPEAPEKTVHRSNSTRSQTGRSDHGTTRSHILAGSTTWAAESKPKTQQNSSPSSSSHGKASQDTAGQGATTKPAEGRSVLSPQRQGETRQESDRKTEIKTRNGSASSQEPNNPGRPVCGYQSKQDQHILMRNRDCAVQSAERSQQSQPVPSILLSAPMHRNKPRSMSHVGAESDRQAIKEKERPKSSQANYPTGSSFLATAEKRDLTSRAKDVAQALMPSSKAANDSEGISKRIASVAESASKKNDAGEHRSQQSSRKYSGEPPERKNNTSGESSRSVGEAPKASKTMPMASGVEIQGQPRPVEAPKNAKATLPSNSGVKLQPSEPTQGQEQRQFDYTMSVTNPEKSTAVETAAPKGPVSAVNTKARRSGQTDLGIPGGSYRDLDEPDSNKTTRKARSNDTLSQGGLRISQSNEEGHRRAASVDVPRSLVPAQRASFAKDLSSAVEIRADNWFTELRNNAHRILEEYKDDCYDVDKTKRRVKIAVLDTGVARSSASGFVSPILKSSRVKLGKALDPSLPWNADSNGHGTHAVGLILTVCPYTDVYVYRVCQDSSYIDKNMVANAILDAVDRRKVDIISMSLGWENDSHDGLRQAVRHARASDVLIFAASSNEGVHSKMAFPARAPEVIAVDAASVYGRPLETNPRAANEKKSDRLTALGQAVGSTWPAALPSDDPQTGRKRLTGTSCATPILAGVAGLVLEFARQRPLCLEQGIEKQLKSVEGMRSVLKHLLCHKYESDTNFNILEPTKLFYVTERYPKGGPCDQPFSPRFLAAHRIVDVLRREY